VRGKGNSGVAFAAQQFLASLSLARFCVPDEAAFRTELDRATEELQNSFPERARFWGLARKCLNVFLCDSFCNLYLHREFRLAVAEKFFEVPLDEIVAKALRRHERQSLPTWPGVKHLVPVVSDNFQRVALDIANTMGITRVHLEIFLWVEGRSNPKQAKQEGSADGNSMAVKLTVVEAMAQVAKELQEPNGEAPIGQAEIVQKVAKRCGCKTNGVMPADHCYNRRNDGIPREPRKWVPMFEHVGPGLYKFLGLNCKYTGPLYHWPKGGQQKQVGEWQAGKLKYFDGETFDESM